MRKAVGLFFLLMALLIAAAIWGVEQVRIYLQSPVNVDNNIIITVKEGMNYTSLTRKLVAQGMIDESAWSRVAGRMYPQFSNLKAGSYQISPNLTLIELFELMLQGKEHQFSVTFVEGITFKQWLETLKNMPHLKQSIANQSEQQIANALGLSYDKLEGLLLPETYYYSAGETDLTLLKRASDALMQVLDEAWQSRDKNLPIKSKYELLILASIIEKETGLEDERRIVSSVFVNRLNINMRLQTDPTVIYGMGDDYDGNITKEDLQTSTPYNTYVIYGLPPTPIAMSGRASIFAAAQPEETSYFYFVAKGDGGHQFSKTLVEHNFAVKAYLNYLKKNK